MSYKLITFKAGFLDLSIEDVEDKKTLSQLIKNAYEIKFSDLQFNKNNQAYTHATEILGVTEYILVIEN